MTKPKTVDEVLTDFKYQIQGKKGAGYEQTKTALDTLYAEEYRKKLLDALPDKRHIDETIEDIHIQDMEDSRVDGFNECRNQVTKAVKEIFG